MTGLRALLALAAASAAVGAAGRALTPQPTRWLTIDGRRVAVTETGEGPPILLIHGLAGQAGNFHRLTPHLAGFRCIIPDRPGTGWSDPAAPGATGLSGHAATAAALIEAMGTGPVLVVGHSLGGAIALRLARDRPDLIAGLVGLGALTGPQVPQLAALGADIGRKPLLRAGMVRLLGAPLAPVMVPMFIAATFGPEPMPPGFAVPGGIYAGLAPRMTAALLRDLRGVAEDTARLRTDLPDLRLPVTLLHGTEDRVLPVAQHALPAALAIPDADLWLPHGGHMLPATQPELVATAIRSTATRAGMAP